MRYSLNSFRGLYRGVVEGLLGVRIVAHLANFLTGAEGRVGRVDPSDRGKLYPKP